MKHYGDVSKINGAEVEPVDIITFGSPCQDMSVAGKRAGIQDGERSNLFFEAVRIIKEMRGATNGEYPKYAVWENVPGAFSSNKGRDFHAVLEALCSVCDDAVSIPEPYDSKRTKLVWAKAGEIVGDNYSVAWRTLDAQYWGVPQRRKRIYLVADFTGRRAGEILFKPEGLRGDLPQGDEAGQGVAADAVGSIDGSSGNGGQLAATVISSYGTKWNGNAGAYNGENFVLKKPSSDGSENLVCYDARGNGDGETACTITGDHQNSITDYTAVAVQSSNSIETYHCNALEEGATTLKARDWKDPQCVSYPSVGTLRKYIIRRLTPTECARLQGFPDWWSTLAPYNPADAEFWEDVRKTHAEINGKKYKPIKDLKKWYDKLHTDSAEYKMWGNGIALPNAEYVLRGISEQGAKTLGSLFDGSGGFPLAGAMNGIKPLWASEVEPFPIAVTRYHFKEVQNESNRNRL